MTLVGSGATVVRMGVGLLLLSGLTGAWGLLARQSPGTPLYLGMLPGPISLLHDNCLDLGLLLVAAGLLTPWAFGQRAPRWWLAMLALGVIASLGGCLYAAIAGMHGVQLKGLRSDSAPLFVVRNGGLLIVGMCLAELGRRVLLRPVPTGAD